MSDLIPPDDRFAETLRGPSAAPAMLPGSPGQGTMIEQARAVADVRAAIMIAREDPRIEADCVEEMRRACSMKEMAEVAFFRVKRGKDEGGGDNMVTGPTIDLANELSRCWRNINSGHKELSRNDQLGQSEVLAYAWDIEKNNRREQTIIIPHKRGKHRVYDTQGIREVIADVAARVEREMIFKVLPTWFRIQAVELCHETLAKGDGRSMEQRIADCKAAFYGIDIMADALERKIGRPAAKWSPEDIAVLTVVFKSIRRGQSDAADEFPPVAPKSQPENVAALEKALNETGPASSGPTWDDPAQTETATDSKVPVDPEAASSPASTVPGTQGGGVDRAPSPAPKNEQQPADDTPWIDKVTTALLIDGGIGSRWMARLEAALTTCQTMDDLGAIRAIPNVAKALKDAPAHIKSQIDGWFRDAAKRLADAAIPAEEPAGADEADDGGWPGPKVGETV
jgi:hypothetical protein